MEARVLWSGVAIWLFGMTLLLRSPRLLGAGVFTSLLALSGLFAFSGGLERATTPLLLQALALGVFLPPKRPARAPRVARRKSSAPKWSLERLRRTLLPKLPQTLSLAASTSATPTAVFYKPERDTSSPLDLWDVPGYEVLEKVGSGGMANVFRARRKRDGALVALKIPNENFVSDDKFIRRFHQEAEVAQGLVHANIVRTLEHGSVGAKHFMVMEFIEGFSLESYIDEPTYRHDYAASCELMRQAAAALSYIHDAGVVHRDIKPANLMLRAEGLRATGTEVSFAPDALKLMDFGVAGGQSTKPTVAGARVGTPIYMSPEQARGLRADERSDVYSLGLVFYELLTGQSAFKGGYEVIVHQQIFQLPPPPRQHDARIPLQLERLVMQMVAKAPEARPSLAEIEYRLAERAPLPELAPKSRLLCTLETAQGSLLILDGVGNVSAPGDVGAALPAPSKACACDSSGNLYLAVTEALEPGRRYPLIHKLAPDGAPLLAFGRYGMKPGEFLRPVALAAAPDDSLWVLDAETHRVEHFQEDGLYLGGFGGPGAGEGRFNDPRDLLVDAHGEVYVLDYGNRQVQRFGADGAYKNRWAFRMSDRSVDDMSATTSGNHSDTKFSDTKVSGTQVPGAQMPGAQAELRLLSGFTLSQAGDLYLREAQTGKVHRIAPQGGTLETLLLGQMATIRPDKLVDLGVDDAGNLFAAERGSSTIFKYAPSGELLAALETCAPIAQLRVDVSA